MTYCVGLRLDRGTVFAADTRTNAGFDEYDGADILTTPEFDWIGGKRGDAS